MSVPTYCRFRVRTDNAHNETKHLITKIDLWLRENTESGEYWNWYYDAPHVVVILPNPSLAMQVKLSIL